MTVLPCPPPPVSSHRHTLRLLFVVAIGLGLWSDAEAQRRVEAQPQVRTEAPPVRSSSPRLRLIETRDGRAVYEVRANWPGVLAETVRRRGSDPHGLIVEAVDGQAAVSEVVSLAALRAPVVEVLAAEYDEAPLGTRSPLERVPEGADEAFALLDGPVAEVASIGMERRRPAGTLVVRLLQVDRAQDVVRRYRRVLVAVQTGTAPSAPMAFATGGGSNPHLAVTRSALADGIWFKIPIVREGVYRLDRAYLQGLGVNVAALDPSRLQLYGNGGAMVPDLAGAPRPADLVENPVLITGAADGTFDEGDALYFYAQGPSGWVWNDEDEQWEHYLNYFDTKSYVFLRVDGAGGARVGGSGFPAWPDAQRQNTFDARLFVEDDRVNFPRNGGGSGLEWLGGETTIGRPTLAVLDTIPPGLAAGTVRYRVRAAARANPSVTLSFRSSGQELASVIPPPVSFLSTTSALAQARVLSFEQPVDANARLALDMVMEGSQNSPQAWLDWAEAVYPRVLRAQEGLLRFSTPGGQAGRFEYALEGFSSEPQVWDVTDLGAIRRLGVRAEGGRFLVQTEVEDGQPPRELIAFTTGSSRIQGVPEGASVANQNLHGVAGFPDYVVVTPAAFREAAEELAAHRRTRDGLQTAVVEIDQVYNEFSGGKVDMRAVRDYVKFLYDRAPTPDDLPQYLLLFGDGHYDFRALLPGGGENNWIPTYQTFESLNITLSYTSDDYFGLLDDEEGVWKYPGPQGSGVPLEPNCTNPIICPFLYERVDVGVGRIPARSAEEAAAVVAKIIHYEDPVTQGAWRSRYTFVADDDLPGNDRDLHIQNADVVAERVDRDYPDINLQKIYSASYADEITAIGRRFPDATADILRAIDEGTLVWNYSGHGGHDGLADERLIDLEDIEQLDNYDRLSIFVTATCSFGRFDMVDRQSGAEQLVLNPNGGAVGLFTTVRLVFASASTTSLNLGLNLRLTEYLLGRDDDGRPRRLGDVMRLTKNTDAGSQGNNRKFSLLGDPAMRIGLPERPVAITAVNGQTLPGAAPGTSPLLAGTQIRVTPDSGLPELRANELAEVTGQVLTFDGQPDASFEGEVDLLVFDSERNIQLDQDITFYTDGDYNVRTDRIYRGRATVRGGQFTARFIVPRDVSYSGLPARISAYVRSSTGFDGIGTSEDVLVSTTAGAPLNDTEGPEVQLWLNDSTFVDGGLVGDEPILVARFSDEHGINTIGAGVGHELLVTFDDDPATAVSIGRFYEGDLDSYQSGTVRFPLPEQAPGPHTLRVTAWDVANNSSTAELSYVVSGDEALTLRNVFNYPNPTTGRTRFIFEHNQPPGTLARLQLRIYSLGGRLVRALDSEEALTGGLVQIPFDGLDEDFDPLASGIYLYHLRVAVDRPDGDTDVTERIERLAIIR